MNKKYREPDRHAPRCDYSDKIHNEGVNQLSYIDQKVAKYAMVGCGIYQYPTIPSSFHFVDLIYC